MPAVVSSRADLVLQRGKARFGCRNFTTSPKRIEDLLRRVRAGILKINCSTANPDVDLPFRGLESFQNRPCGAWPRQSRVLHSHAVEYLA